MAALPIGAVLFLLRDQPWNRGSFAGLVIAMCIGVGVVYVSIKIALGLPVSEPQSPYASASQGWLNSGWGIVVKLIILGCAGAALTLYF